MGWHTLKKILAHSDPPGYRQSQARPRRVLSAVLPIIHEIVEADHKAPRKHQHTAKRAEGGVRLSGWQDGRRVRGAGLAADAPEGVPAAGASCG